MHTLICRKCGKEFQAQLISSKFCSRECAGHAAKSVMEKTCPMCGKVFTARDKRQRFCSIACSCRNASKCSNGRPSGSFVSGTDASLREIRRRDEINAQKRRERIRLRDDAYERWERANGVHPTVTVSEGVRTEIRGRVSAGCRSVNFVKHI